MAVAFATVAPAHADDFVNFESEHVRPLALAPGGALLFAVNTPDGRLAIYRVEAGGVALAGEVPVGLEPVAVSARTNAGGRIEAWVVNHVSDSVSVVEVDPADPGRARVVRTLLVGDEPRDVVFAGPRHARAFVSCARRGQNRFPGAEASGPQLTTEGVGRADVWVFDADDPGVPPGGTPLGIVQLFGDTPRALAATPDGTRVYAAVFRSGNRTTCVNESARASMAGLPPPPAGGREDGPSTGLIVKFDPAAGQWRDELGRDWSPRVNFTLPDQDVFVLDAFADPPARASGTTAFTGVGTILLSMAVNPTTGALYVGNTEARNQVRFVGTFDETRGVTGHFSESRVTVVAGTTVRPVHLNPHVDYAVVPGPPSEIDRSLAFPAALAVSDDGTVLFVAGHGSAKVGVFDAADLARGVVTESQLPVGLGPSGLVFDGTRDRLYVMNAIDQAISVVANASDPARAVIATVPLPFDPTPPVVRNGRPFLYDARRSAHGDASCASCHVFGDTDGLAWDLGDPFGSDVPNPNPFRGDRTSTDVPFHPMKGPMVTQSLRGLANAGAMHWRGDRTGGNDPGGDPFDEAAAFMQFDVAFHDLLGAAAPLDPAEMQAFTDFALTLRYPPNPIRRLDDSLTPAQARGLDLFVGFGAQPCGFCHIGSIATAGYSSFDGEPQAFKVPHLRAVYQKVGMFGVPSDTLGIPETGPFGDQIRGFGILHDGATATVFDGLRMIAELNDDQRRDLEAYLLAFDTGLKSIVGQQVTVTPATVADARTADRVALLAARAEAHDCELVVQGTLAGEARGWWYDDARGQFESDRVSESRIAPAELYDQAAQEGQERTYTCVPPGAGRRIALDRDRDGFANRTELDAGTDPADPAAVPQFPGSTVRIRASAFHLSGGGKTHAARSVRFKAATKRDALANRVTPPAPSGPGDPTIVGGTITLFNSAGSGETATIVLPASGWASSGSGKKRAWVFRSTTGPVARVALARDRLVVTGGRTRWPYTLDEPTQGRIAIVLTVGTEFHWCAETGRAPYAARADGIGRFVARPQTPPPAVCPRVP